MEFEAKQEQIQLYMERDNTLQINPRDQIRFSLDKLGYNYVNKEQETTDFIKNYFLYAIKIGDYNPEIMEYNNWLAEFKDSCTYKKFLINLDDKIARSIILSKYAGTDKINEFYNACTLSELYYVGY
jgi:hypothetical protein